MGGTPACEIVKISEFTLIVAVRADPGFDATV
jgi:hypothetical protein